MSGSELRQKTPLLSLSMIVRNEERFLDGCLESVRGIVDEIVIVDTGSTDGTIAIAERHGAKVYTFPWCDDFSAARNASLDHVTGEWVLYLDADERLKPGQASDVRGLLRQRSAGAINTWVEGYHHLRQGSTIHRMAYPRIFRNHPRIRFSGRVHEQIYESLKALGLPSRNSDVVIEHLGYGQGVEVVLRKAERNLAILLRDRDDHPTEGYVRYQIGNTLDVLGRYAEARGELERALTMDLSESIRAATHSVLAGIARHEGRHEDGVRHADASLAIAPTQRLGTWLRCVNLLDLKRYREALDGLSSIARDPSEAPRGTVLTANDVIIEEWKIAFHKALCHEGLGDFEEAGRLFLLVRQACPDENEPLDGFLRTATRRPFSMVLTKQFREIAALGKPSGRVHVGFARVWKNGGREAEAWGEIDQARALDPGDKEIYATMAEWAVLGGDTQAIPRIIENAKKLAALSFPLYKAAVDDSIRRQDFSSGLIFLKDMVDTIPGQVPEEFKPRLHQLLTKLQILEDARK